MVLKFHDDPTVNESGIIVFLRQVLWYAGKRRFWEEEGKNENVAQKEAPDLTWLFISRVLSLLFALYLFIYTKKLFKFIYEKNGMLQWERECGRRGNGNSVVSGHNVTRQMAYVSVSILSVCM